MSGRITSVTGEMGEAPWPQARSGAVPSGRLGLQAAGPARGRRRAARDALVTLVAVAFVAGAAGCSAEAPSSGEAPTGAAAPVATPAPSPLPAARLLTATPTPAAPAGSPIVAPAPDRPDAPAIAARATVPTALKDVDLTPWFADARGRVALGHFEARRWDDAWRAFDAIVSADPRARVATPAAVMAARALDAAGRHADAARRYDLLVKLHPVLADDHRARRASALLAAGDAKGALEVARAVPATATAAPRASLVAARALLALGRPDDARKQLETHAKKWGGGDARRLLGDAQAALGRTKEAASSYRLVMARYPQSAESRAAKKALDALAAKAPRKERSALVSLTRDETLLRAEKLFERHKSDDVIGMLTPLAKGLRKGTSERCNALQLIARSWDKLRKRASAEPHWAAYAAECGNVDPGFALNLYFAGKSSVQTGDYARALEYFGRLHREWPEHTANDDALVYEAYIHGQRGDATKRRKALLRAVGEYADGDKRDEVAWQLVWDAWSSGDMAATVKAADDVLARIERESEYYSEGRTLYWKGRALESLGRTDDATAAWRAVLETYPLGWYAHLSLGRLADQLGDDEARRVLAEVEARDPAPKTPLIEASPELLRSGAFLRGVELLRLGLYAEARKELDRLPGAGAGRDWLVAWLYDRVGAYPLSHNIPRRKHPEFQAHYPTGEHALAWAIAYPRPYEDLVTAAAANAGVDPALAWSIMREESGFNPSIESWANAVGLMQLMHGTAKDLLEKGEKDTISGETLRDPELNVRLGTRYLGRLQERYLSPALVAAGYNAGSGAVRSWLKERGALALDEFVERIPYQQTRDYVKRVVGSYGAYRALYAARPLALSLAMPGGTGWDRGGLP